ncbi:MAG TPA: histidine phosphatase family protein [Methylomirabilota bacterium]|nr:histidine phosphatase family protein [Methylomirabilota bacterium]
MTTRLTLICHAATAATRAAAFPLDEPIEAGAPERAPGLPQAERVWTSPALRARQTAEALGLAATPEPALRDCDFGRWAGRRLADLQAAEPAAVAAWLGDPAAAPHGGESLLDLLARVASWLEARAGERGHGIAITHPAIIRAAIVHALAAPPAAFWRIDIEPLSLTELRRSPQHWTLRATGCPLAP